MGSVPPKYGLKLSVDFLVSRTLLQIATNTTTIIIKAADRSFLKEGKY